MAKRSDREAERGRVRLAGTEGGRRCMRDRLRQRVTLRRERKRANVTKGARRIRRDRDQLISLSAIHCGGTALPNPTSASFTQEVSL